MARQSVKIKPRENVFADTAAFVALLIRRDKFYQSANAIMAELSEKDTKLFTTEMALVELANALSSVELRGKAIILIDELQTLPNVEIVWSSVELFEKAWTLYRERPDKEWSLTDCASFVVMRERGINTAFTSDKHFEQAGFVRLLEN
ncbi:MAG: PIN domain-containing protein [Acidobacteriota bacterium]|nr:PIN domain-containing protein [Acidobacteriota bacterium]